MIDDYDPLMQKLERESREQQARTREVIAEAGRPDVLADYDAAMKDIRTGVSSARGTWHALSKAQRALIESMGAQRIRLERRESQPNIYDGVGHPQGFVFGRMARLPTVRNLAAREILAWDGGLLDPEAAAVLTDHGRFVLKHGPSPSATAPPATPVQEG